MSTAEKRNELLDYARARASEWGSILRQAGWHGAPNPNYYRESPYLVVRGDLGQESLEHNDREMRAAVVDRFYRALREKMPKEAEAMWLQFAASQPGRHAALVQQDKMRLWYAFAREGKSRFYTRLSTALDGLSLYLLEIVE